MKSDPVGTMWAGEDGTVGLPPEIPIHEVLRWVLRQIHRGNIATVCDDDGQALTLVLGKAAAPEMRLSEWFEYTRRRQLALMFAGHFAQSRERGADQKWYSESEEIRFSADEGGLMNTELHYGLELIDILKHIRARTMNLITLPLVNIASQELVLLMGEATRCFLFGMHQACAALCRAVVEKALKERLDHADVVAERSTHPDRGDLECMINVAGRKKLLDKTLVGYAHQVRTKGNATLHPASGDAINDAFVVLSDARLVVERLFASGGAAQKQD